MPKSKTAEADNTPAESPKRAPATKPKAPAAMHKRITKKTVETVVPAPEPVRVISTDEISRLAYSYWESRGYRGGSAEEDWFRAERELFKFPQDR